MIIKFIHIVLFQAVQPGQQIAFSYGERSSDDFFVHYGFVPPLCNPHEVSRNYEACLNLTLISAFLSTRALVQSLFKKASMASLTDLGTSGLFTASHNSYLSCAHSMCAHLAGLCSTAVLPEALCIVFLFSSIPVWRVAPCAYRMQPFSRAWRKPWIGTTRSMGSRCVFQASIDRNSTAILQHAVPCVPVCPCVSMYA